jgi:hypothetical protein
MTAFYQQIIIEKSWQILKQLKKEIDFILIGGWAVYLYTKALKSKDIDIIVNYDQLGRFRKKYQVFKNERLAKYEIKKEGIDIDIYLPYFSNLGLPVEKLINFVEKKETFTVLEKEALLVAKLKAFSDRKATIKGQKDKIDIISLLFLPDFDFEFLRRIVKDCQLADYLKMAYEILMTTQEVQELGFNKHFFAKKKKEVLGKFDI